MDYNKCDLIDLFPRKIIIMRPTITIMKSVKKISHGQVRKIVDLITKDNKIFKHKVVLVRSS